MNLVTRPAWRRRGIATALLLAVLDALQAESITVASLHATSVGQGIYEAAGFESSNEWVCLLP
jgi:predicted GNAT family acetyltransferase